MCVYNTCILSMDRVHNYVHVYICSVLDAVDAQFSLLSAALEKRRKELRVEVMERTQVRVHALMTQTA